MRFPPLDRLITNSPMKLFLQLVLSSLCVFSVTSLRANEDQIKLGDLLHTDDFDGGLEQWQVEQALGGTVTTEDGKLVINDRSGCTVWFKTKLTGPFVIEFEATLIDKGGKNDRVSDLNCFWMATDPKNPDDIFANGERAGKFGNYHSLQLYYVGYGANENSTTRFRRYAGDGTRPVLPEHDLGDKKFLHKPNETLTIRIICQGSRIKYQRNGETVFDFIDPEPLTEGWFGFRTVRNHMEIDNFRVHRMLSVE